MCKPLMHFAAIALLLCAATDSLPSLAQVSEPTDADKANVPLPFRPDDQKKGAAVSFAPHGTPPGYVPVSDPRDFTGTYVSDAGGPPPPGPKGQAGPPPGPPPTPTCVPSFDYGAYAIHIVSSPQRLTVVGEENHRIRRIYIGETLPAEPQAAYAGYSVGRWEGKTLVVDTVAIRGRPRAHLRERWTREKNGSIDIESMDLGGAEDTKSAKHTEMIWRPDLRFVENICEDFGEAFGASYGASKSP